MPSGCIFADKGPAIFVEGNKLATLSSLLALMNSCAFNFLINLQMAFGSYEVGVIQRTPVPDLDNPQGARLGELALACVELKRDLDRANETSHVFHLPALLQVAVAPPPPTPPPPGGRGVGSPPSPLVFKGGQKMCSECGGFGGCGDLGR
jgi:hypothetical protein